MAEEEILIESDDGRAGIRYLPNGGMSKEGVELPKNTIEVFAEGRIEFSQLNKTTEEYLEPSSNKTTEN